MDFMTTIRLLSELEKELLPLFTWSKRNTIINK